MNNQGTTQEDCHYKPTPLRNGKIWESYPFVVIAFVNNLCNTPEKLSIPLKSDVANKMAYFCDVVVCRQDIYCTKF